MSDHWLNREVEVILHNAKGALHEESGDQTYERAIVFLLRQFRQSPGILAQISRKIDQVCASDPALPIVSLSRDGYHFGQVTIKSPLSDMQNTNYTYEEIDLVSRVASKKINESKPRKVLEELNLN